ncbi:MAG: hypothetical protein U9P61_01745 [Patescibacteria group bacterium]|nr:hypothetical protein [Patescibacteria group bacterium]
MNDFTGVTQQKLVEFWDGFISFIPNLTGALIVLIVGWIVAIAVGKIIGGVLYRLKFNEPFKGEKWNKAMKQANIDINPSDFLGKVIKWIVFILVIWIVADILKLNQVTDFVGSIIAYIPNIIAATLIFIIAVIIGELLSKLIIATIEKSELPYSRMAGTIIKVAIWIFATFAILIQLGIAKDLLMVLFSGLIAFMVIAGGLAFGLGGKDAATKFIETAKKSIK